MTTDNMNPLLDDLFAEARTEVPKHTFADTRKVLLAGLAIGGASLLGAKIITSSILKSKFFIMSISAITILTSAVLVYTTGLKPNNDLSSSGTNAPNELVAVNIPMGSQLPDNLFVAAIPQEVEETPAVAEPGDTVIIIRKDSIVDVQEIIEEVMQSLNLEALEVDMEQLMESISNIEIDIDMHDLEGSIEDMLEGISEIDIDIDEEDFAELRIIIEDFTSDSVNMSKLMSMSLDLEAIGKDLELQLHNLKHAPKTIMLNRTVYSSSDLTKKVFTISNHTTNEDLEDFNKQATAAGMDVTYQAHVWKNRIKSLHMRLEIDGDNSKRSTDIHIRKIKRNENFVQNIIWYENAEGQAVKFKKTSECNDHDHDVEEY